MTSRFTPRLSTLLLVASAFALPALAFAQEGIIQNPLQSESLVDLLMGVLRGVVRVGLFVLLLALVYVGFQFAAAQGSEEKIRSARGALLWTVVGGIILAGAEAIAALVTSTASSFAP